MAMPFRRFTTGQSYQVGFAPVVRLPAPVDLAPVPQGPGQPFPGKSLLDSVYGAQGHIDLCSRGFLLIFCHSFLGSDLPGSAHDGLGVGRSSLPVVWEAGQQGLGPENILVSPFICSVYVGGY